MLLVKTGKYFSFVYLVRVGSLYFFAHSLRCSLG